MNSIILMGIRRHKTVRVEYIAPTVLVPAEVRPDEFSSTHEFRDVVFSHAGFVCGEPVYYQTKGPELPDSWWTRDL